jgi:hypothetical protein
MGYSGETNDINFSNGTFQMVGSSALIIDIIACTFAATPSQI